MSPYFLYSQPTLLDTHSSGLQLCLSAFGRLEDLQSQMKDFVERFNQPLEFAAQTKDDRNAFPSPKQVSEIKLGILVG